MRFEGYVRFQPGSSGVFSKATGSTRSGDFMNMTLPRVVETSN